METSRRFDEGDLDVQGRTCGTMGEGAGYRGAARKRLARGPWEPKKNFIKVGVLFQKAVATVATVATVKNGLKMLKKGRNMAKMTQKQAF
jgi:hypothetical protein